MTETPTPPSTPPDPPIAEPFEQAAPSQNPDPAAAAPPVSPIDPAMEAALAKVVRRLDRRARRKSAAALRDASFGWLADGLAIRRSRRRGR